MIRPEELRVGNWVNYHNDNTYFKVEEIYVGGVSVANGGGAAWVEFERFSGIPLTEEILVKAGFEFREDGEEVCEQTWHCQGFEIWQHESGFCHDYHKGGHINYLHHLQNLFHSLTNEELNIQL